MYFQLTPPSISKIRAKFIIEKLRNFPQSLGSINIFATGRTHSGKTTLGNRLLGIDYFLSTGRQDCTKEINLIEFPIGLKYFDLPGVCSDDFLENYNRVAFGMSQIEDFPWVDEVTLAKFKENQAPSEQKLSISDYDNLGFQPDLVYYLIAPDKQFARGDKKYLKDLLRRNQNIIYVFNMFVNKQTGVSYSATEANITDATIQILKVHNSILGEERKPVIVGVNCWTGEGISELLHQSQLMLSGEKGSVFEDLIQYQREKTPDEYVKQVKEELIRLYAHTACQRAIGTDTCDQPLHEICYTLFDFLCSLPIQTEQVGDSISEKVNTIVQQVFANPIEQIATESLGDKVNYVIQASNYILNQSIESFNELIKTYISDIQEQAYEMSNTEMEQWSRDKENYSNQLSQKWDAILSVDQEISRLKDVITSQESQLEYLANDFSSYVEKHKKLSFEISSRRQRLNSRIERFNERMNRYNNNVDKINRSSARLTYDAEQSIKEEEKNLRREKESILNEDRCIDELIVKYEKHGKKVNQKKEEAEHKIAENNYSVENHDRKIEELRNKLKERNKFKKEAQDEINFWFELIKAFQGELSSFDDKVNTRIEEMNHHLREIRIRLSENYLEKFESVEDGINELQEVINTCIDEMGIFENQIFEFSQEINKIIFRLNINKMVTQVLQKTTEHYFDQAGEFEYRGSHYHYFRQHGIAISLALTTMTLVGLEEDYEVFYNTLLQKVERLGYFPDDPVESNILALLESNLDSLFDSSWEQAIRKAVS
ncbi:hypothetical protein [Roseofilum capinflatum]|uniref:G domain-containing protein n=1 Tax=Roseofilum capinflatum BLCC-M114 TaxID=3022440 RepID=A0ABT7B241_9CYAN|nr:hypothetical protein [Roseofilum capinflatum]MDJ1173235.1 hypothetical protein [Roseofilum capinflatum BLCC-M114]